MISLGTLRISNVVQCTQDCKTMYYASLLISQLFYLVFNPSPLKLYLPGSVLSIPECASLSLRNSFRKKEYCPSVCIQLKCTPDIENSQYCYSVLSGKLWNLYFLIL